MSTRATYQFDTDHTGRHTFYGHYDGYRAGAAFRLWLMHHTKSKGTRADAFLRANDDVELTKSHAHHGDTEFRYSIDARGELRVQERTFTGADSPKWRTTWYGRHYAAFINEFLLPEWCEQEGVPPAERLQEVTLDHGARRWLTRSQIQAEIDALYDAVHTRGLKQYAGKLSVYCDALYEHAAAVDFETA